MAEYNVESFKHCLFNPLSKDLIKKYPVLAGVSKDEKLLRYILCLFDPKSPLIRDCRNNIKTRKQEAARLAGYDFEKDTNFLDDLYSFQNKEAANGAIIFLREHIHNRIWTMIVSHEQTFYEYNERLLKPVKRMAVSSEGLDEDEEDITGSATKEKDIMATIAMKSKLIKDLKEIHTYLNEYYKEMFEDEDLREQVVVTKFTPENMSRV